MFHVSLPLKVTSAVVVSHFSCITKDTEFKIAQMILFTNSHCGSLEVLCSFTICTIVKKHGHYWDRFSFADGITECFVEVLSHKCTKKNQKIDMKNEK